MNVSRAVTNWLVLNEPCARVCGVKPALRGDYQRDRVSELLITATVVALVLFGGILITLFEGVVS